MPLLWQRSSSESAHLLPEKPPYRIPPLYSGIRLVVVPRGPATVPSRKIANAMVHARRLKASIPAFFLQAEAPATERSRRIANATVHARRLTAPISASSLPERAPATARSRKIASATVHARTAEPVKISDFPKFLLSRPSAQGRPFSCPAARQSNNEEA